MTRPELQIRLLEALQMLEFDGVPLVNANDPNRRILYRFNGGVPWILLRGWLDAKADSLRIAIRISQRLELVSDVTADLFRSIIPGRRNANARVTARLLFLRPDDKLFQLYWEPMPDVGGFLVSAGAGQLQPDGRFALDVPMFGYRKSAAEQFVRITGAGLRWLEDRRKATEDSTPVDELVTLSQVTPLTGYSKRTLERWVTSGILPKADVVGGNGLANKWYWSALRPALEKHSKRILPQKFPGSRIT